MKRILSLIIVISMILSMSTFLTTVTAAQDVLFSDSFEDGMSQWTLVQPDYEDKISVVNEEASDGKHSIKFSDDITDITINITTEKISVKGGYDYILYADAKVAEGDGAKLYLRFLNSEGKSVLSQSVSSSSKEWSTIAKTFSAPKEAESAVILIWAQNTTLGVSYFDNIKLVEKGESFIDTYEVKTLEDGESALSIDFETPLDNSWRFDSEQNSETIYVSNEAYSAGKSSLVIVDDNNEAGMGITSRKFGVEGGSTYTLSADFHISNGTSAKLYLIVYDANGKKLQSTSHLSKAKKWTRITKEHTLPEDAAYVVINIQVPSSTTGKTFIDNINLYKGKVNVGTIDASLAKALTIDYRTVDYVVPEVYKMPEFKPTIGHPRLYFNKGDIEKIKSNATHIQNKSAYEKLLSDVANTSDGKLKDDASNLDSKVMGIIQSKAFYYAVWGDEKAGREAVSMLNNFLDTAHPESSEYNTQGLMVFTIAAVYDWCFPLLSEIDKKYFANMGCVAASTMEITFPPVVGNVINGHSAEAQLQRDQMALAIAVYDERPDIYQNIAGRYFDEMVYSKQWLATAKASMFGDSYSTYRYQWEVIACYMMSALGVDNIYGEDHGKTLYWNLYARRGDGQVLRDGDSVGNHNAKDAYDTRGTRSFFLAGNYYKDPYLKGEYMRQNNGMIIGDVSGNQTLGAVEFLCFNDPSVEYKTARELPLSMYYPTPKGDMIARTGWAEGKNSPVVVAEMSVDEYFTLAHDHLDSGEFEIYYKGALATDTGYYQAYRGGSTTENTGNTLAGSVHFYNYERRTIAHNCMLVYDPNEDPVHFNNNVNDGGQTSGLHFAEGVTHVKDYLKKEDQYHFANVMGREIGEDLIQPDYTYLKGDLQNAYGEKVPEYERSFMFLNLKNNDYPAVMVVFDRVVSKDKSFKKSWVMHGMNKPEVNGQRSVFRRGEDGYNGKLTVDTLLPKAGNTAINVVGGEGQEHMVNGTSYIGKGLDDRINEGGGYRIEVSPKAQSEKDYFLNVLQVGDNDRDLAPLESEMIEGNTHYGVKVYDRVVMFGKEKDRTTNTVNFDVKGDGWYKFTVADLKEGTWQVKKDGSNLCEIVSAKDGGVGSFEAGSGAYTLTYVDAHGEKQFTETPFSSTEGINLKMDATYIYSDVEPFTHNGRTLVPMRAIFEALKANVTWDEATKTATGERGGTVIKITENSSVALVDGQEVTLDAPAIIKNGRFVVPVRFIAESFGVIVSWDDFSKTVTFKDLFSPKHDIANTIFVKSAQQYGNSAGSVTDSLFDGSFSTAWAISKDDNGNPGYGIFDFGSSKDIESMHLAFNTGTSRVYTFSIYTSDDGVNWTLIKDKLKSSGTSLKLEKFDINSKGRYIKLEGHGNSVNAWNNYTEIVFTGK